MLMESGDIETGSESYITQTTLLFSYTFIKLCIQWFYVTLNVYCGSALHHSSNSH